MSEISVGSVKITGFDKKTWYNPGDWFGQHDEEYRKINEALGTLVDFGIKVKIGEITFEQAPSENTTKIKQKEIKNALQEVEGVTNNELNIPKKYMKEGIEELILWLKELVSGNPLDITFNTRETQYYDLIKIRNALTNKTIDFRELHIAGCTIGGIRGQTKYDSLVKTMLKIGLLNELAILRNQAPPEQNRTVELEGIMREKINFDQDARPLAEQQIETRHAVEEYETLGEATVDDIRIAQLGKVLSDDSANFYAKQTALFELRKFSGDEKVKGILLRFIEENADAEGTFLDNGEKSWLVRTAIGSLRIIDSAHWDKLTAEEVRGSIEPREVFYHYVENKLISKLKKLVKDAKIHGKDREVNVEGRSERAWNEDGLKSALADGAKFVKIS